MERQKRDVFRPRRGHHQAQSTSGLGFRVSGYDGLRRAIRCAIASSKKIQVGDAAA